VKETAVVAIIEGKEEAGGARYKAYGDVSGLTLLANPA
jgi:hypothetical protein